MRIIEPTEAISVAHPIVVIIGQHGVGKTSLGYSMPDALLGDYDGGAHRAINRRSKTAQFDKWMEAEELKPFLQGRKSYVVDTVGRALDFLADDIIANEPKMNRGGGELSLQGFGRLKSRFRKWLNTLKAYDIDVLLIAHDKEEKKGDNVIKRADITGGSYAEVMRQADFCGYLHMVGTRRVLDFSPTEEWVGKNPAQWAPFEVPPPEKATEFMAKLYAMGREALGKISGESAQLAQQVEEWRDKIADVTTPVDFNDMVPFVQAIEPAVVQVQVKQLLMKAAKAKGIEFDRAQKKFVGPPEPEPEKREMAATDLGW